MPFVIWKGAISFGLVHLPVALYPASQDVGVDFDWLDKRSMDPVGYQRVNKRTGEAIESDNIVKGIRQDDGDYVVLSEDQIKAAYPKTTQTIEIESFVQARDISFTLLERPYYLEPIGKGEKVYALLREAMREAGVIGIARVVMHTKEHLAALIPSGAALVLNTLRRVSEIRSIDELKLPAKGKDSASLKPSELKMAAQLISDMTAPWKSDEHADQFSLAVHELVNRKVAVGETEQVRPLEEEGSANAPSNVIDLTELLANSLAKRKPVRVGSAESPAPAKPVKTAAASKMPAKKRA